MKYNKLTFLSAIMLTIMMCVPPADTGATAAQDKKRLDSLRNVRCPRLMSSAAEYYRNRDWKQTVKIYEEITTLDCDETSSLLSLINFSALLTKSDTNSVCLLTKF